MYVKSVSGIQEIKISFNPNNNPINGPSCCSEFYLFSELPFLPSLRMGILPRSCKHRGSGELIRIQLKQRHCRINFRDDAPTFPVCWELPGKFSS